MRSYHYSLINWVEFFPLSSIRMTSELQLIWQYNTEFHSILRCYNLRYRQGNYDLSSLLNIFQPGKARLDLLRFCKQNDFRKSGKNIFFFEKRISSFELLGSIRDGHWDWNLGTWDWDCWTVGQSRYFELRDPSPWYKNSWDWQSRPMPIPELYLQYNKTLRSRDHSQKIRLRYLKMGLSLKITKKFFLCPTILHPESLKNHDVCGCWRLSWHPSYTLKW